MDLKKCKILLDAIDYRNLSKVAKDYGYTPSGIWHMIDTIAASFPRTTACAWPPICATSLNATNGLPSGWPK